MPEPMLTARDVARRMGISERAVFRLKDKPGGLPAYKLGGSIRFKSEEVEAYINSQTVKPPEKAAPFVEKRFHYVPGMKVV